MDPSQGDLAVRRVAGTYLRFVGLTNECVSMYVKYLCIYVYVHVHVHICICT